MDVRPATSADVADVADVLAEAFAGDPPMRWFVADATDREQRFRRYFATAAEHYLRHGELWVCAEPTGAAAWAPPGAWPYPVRLRLPLVWAEARLFSRHARRAVAGGRAIARDHPHQPHWYLEWIGVAAAGRGRGVGSALLEARLSRCDRAAEAAYLNAGSPRSRELYRRHGFEVTDEFRLPSNGPPLWRMWREPVPARMGR